MLYICMHMTTMGVKGLTQIPGIQLRYDAAGSKLKADYW